MSFTKNDRTNEKTWKRKKTNNKKKRSVWGEEVKLNGFCHGYEQPAIIEKNTSCYWFANVHIHTANVFYSKNNNNKKYKTYHIRIDCRLQNDVLCWMWAHECEHLCPIRNMCTVRLSHAKQTRMICKLLQKCIFLFIHTHNFCCNVPLNCIKQTNMTAGELCYC